MAGFPITAYALCNALGETTDRALRRLRAGESGLAPCPLPLPFEAICGAIPAALPGLPAELAGLDTRQARVLHQLLTALAEPLAAARERWGAGRVGVALGTSTAGMAETERAYLSFRQVGRTPPGYDFFRHHQPDALVTVARAVSGFEGPALTLSTACSSSAKVFGVARRWLELEVCDAVLVGGVDTLCQITLRGFQSLELLSPKPCRPFSAERAGLNIGEGGGLALIERRGAGKVRLVGVGESSDAHHMTAPHPEGSGAVAAMREALAQAGLGAEAVDHVNAHGTGTRLNDAAEALAIARVFGDRVPVVSTKGYTGHLLGAAGITEALFAVVAIEEGWIPASLGARPVDPSFGIRVAAEREERPIRVAMSNSFAFGGSNAAVLFAEAA
ncbi:MAG: beta-ketoacyl-ACP synthase [Myxococcales bacterium]